MTRLLLSLGISALLLAGAGCSPGEGERCNPMLFNDECSQGLKCTFPAGCGVSFCCPVSTSSSNANCQQCPVQDGGAMDATPG